MKSICFILLIILLMACEGSKKEIPPVEFYFDQKKENLKAEEMEECRQDAIEKAEKFVDSLIDRWIKDQNNKEINFPIKPKRPNSPDKIIGQD